MFRTLLLSAALLLPVALPAQYLQDERTADYSLRTLLTKEDDSHYFYQIQFRNEQLFEANRLFAITDVLVAGVAGSQGVAGRGDSPLGAGTIGDVYQRPLPRANSQSDPVTFFTNWFSIPTPIGPNTSVYGGSSTSNSISDGLGLLGCSVPVFPTPSQGNNYAGSTCSTAGFAGWETISFRFTFFQPTPNFTGSGLTATLLTAERARVTVNVVPEPTTFALAGLGMLIVGAVAGRRT